MKKTLGVYIHIPFCARKCAYCDFLSVPAKPDIQKAYVEQLTEEIRQSGEILGGYEIKTVFFGGGTPSILKADWLVGILESLRTEAAFSEETEITVEANPGTVDKEKLLCYREAGINRLSFGLQSADNNELYSLGRIHTWEQFLESYECARKVGFQNMNVDLMSALPGQTAAGWRKTLEKVLVLQPEHLSAYSLIIEEGTPFYEKYGGHPNLLPSEEEERQMYHDTKEILKEQGYERYEISNYAKQGYVCRHNLGYWNRTDYKGFGLGAASLLNNVRTANQTKFWEYLKGNREGSAERLSKQAIREEHFFLGLRKTEGVAPGEYREHYQELITRLKEQGLLKEEDAKVRLTDFGIDVSNYVLAQFLD